MVPENYCLAHNYQLAKFSDLMSCSSKDLFKNAFILKTYALDETFLEIIVF